MSNLKKDIDEIVFRCFAQGQYWGTEADGKLDPGYKPEKPIDRTQAVNNILNLIESVIPEEIDVKSKYETDDDGGIIVVVDENNDTMTGENLVHLARLASDEGYNQAIKDIKNKLIGKE